jgi:hypothetical protein
MSYNTKICLLLSVLITILAAIASAGGLCFDRLYRDNQFVIIAWRSSDLVTLFIVVPSLIIALILSQRGAQRAYLVWMGMLDYMLYNYAFYLFAAAFNWFFLIYAAIVGLSIFALILGLISIDLKAIFQGCRKSVPTQWIAGYMLFSAIGLSFVYLTQSINFIITGQLPSIIARTGSNTSIVFALDLTLLIPMMILGAVWLLQHRPWGYILAGISTVKGPAYTLVLTIGCLQATHAGMTDALAEMPIWIFLTTIGGIAAGLFFGNMKTVKSTPILVR